MYKNDGSNCSPLDNVICDVLTYFRVGASLDHMKTLVRNLGKFMQYTIDNLPLKRANPQT